MKTHENLNIEIKTNKTKFLDYFKHLIHKKSKTFF